MELRKLAVCLTFLFAVSVRSEARHSVHRREATNEVNYEDTQADEASDVEAQNDADGGDEPETYSEDDQDVRVEILTKPTRYNITIGRSVRIECKVNPPNLFVVSWKKDGEMYFLGNQKVSPLDKISIYSNTTDLVIKDVDTSDSGTYTCQVMTNDLPSINHTVIVTESPRIISFTASDDSQPIEGTNLLLVCNATGSPPPRITWSRLLLDTNVLLNERDGEASGDTFLIKNIKRDQSGKYYCYAFNSIGQAQAEINIKVKGKPRIHVHRTIVNSAINVEAILECSVHEESPLHIRWYKDGRLIEDSSTQYSITTYGSTSNLTVIPTSEEDFGTFTCEAENDFDKHSRSIKLVQKPVIEDLDVDGSKLTWRVHSHQPLEQIELQLRDIENGDWRTLNVPVPEGQRHEYEIIYVLDEDKTGGTGKYEALVKVKNNNSWSENIDPVLVEIETQPAYIQHASVYRGTSHSIRPAIISTLLMYVLVRML